MSRIEFRFHLCWLCGGLFATPMLPDHLLDFHKLSQYVVRPYAREFVLTAEEYEIRPV